MWEELGQLLVVVSKVLSKEKLHCSSTTRTDPWSSSSEQQSTGWTWDQSISAVVHGSTSVKRLV